MDSPAPRPFGVLPDGTAVAQIVLRNDTASCALLTYGGALRAMTVPDWEGRPVDVALGFDMLADYVAQDKYLGAIVGRYANRIGGDSFPLNGKDWPIARNDGGINHLHGGNVGFDRQVWTVEALSHSAVTLSLVSPDGQEGYPGTLSVRVTYQLTGCDLRLDYEAVSDADTLCNLTNHAYWNLAGHNSGAVADQLLQLHAAFFTPIGPGSIPTGQIAPVDDTPMDLRQPLPMGLHWDDDFPQLTLAAGYDHNWCVDGEVGTLRPAAWACSPATGITLEVLTTMPGIQCYTGNFLDGCPAGKGGAVYKNRCGFALETQFYPDSPHHSCFPSAVLRKGTVYRQTTIYRFGLIDTQPSE
jgi:aldose 1-epimerase